MKIWNEIGKVNDKKNLIEKSDNEIGNFSYLDMECPRRTRPGLLPFKEIFGQENKRSPNWSLEEFHPKCHLEKWCIWMPKWFSRNLWAIRYGKWQAKLDILWKQEGYLVWFERQKLVNWNFGEPWNIYQRFRWSTYLLTIGCWTRDLSQAEKSITDL